MLILWIVIFFVSCSEQPKMIRKKIDNKDVSIVWYYYSNIEGNSPDIIEIQKARKKIVIYKSYFGVYDVSLTNGKIWIYTLPKNSQKMKYKELFEYKIYLDTLGKNFNGWDKVPIGK